MIVRSLSTAADLLFGLQSVAIATTPLVPRGWREIEKAPAGARTFVSEDGTARLRIGHSAAHPGDLQADIDRMVQRPGESITYQQRNRTWVAVPGYRGGKIFYRKGNLACGGTRCHLIEFRYPRQAKRQMDAAVAKAAHRMGAFRDDCQ